MNNLLKVLFVAVGVAILSVQAWADEVITSLDQLQPVVELNSEEIVLQSYQKVLNEFDEIKTLPSDEFSPEMVVRLISLQQLSVSDEFALITDVIKGMPEDSYSSFTFSNFGYGESAISMRINKVGAEYLYSLGLFSISSEKGAVTTP